MQRQSLTLAEAMDIGKQACSHARDIVKKGSSQIENNDLPFIYFMSLGAGMKESPEGKWTGVRETAINLMDTMQSADPLMHPNLVNFEGYIQAATKYSLGNCHELSLLALDYLLLKNINVNAEIYSIRNRSKEDTGSHVFLVLNRTMPSDTEDPFKWGDDAVICDPWANKVYKASDYLEELKIHYYDDKKNRLMDFNPFKHRLKIHHRYSLDILKDARNVNYVVETFKNIGGNLIQALDIYKNELDVEFERLKNKYNTFDEKILIIADKINEVEIVATEIRELFNTATYLIETDEYKNNYSATKLYLNPMLEKMYKKVITSMQFSDAELAILLPHKSDSSLTEVMKFFGIKSQTHKTLKNLTDTVNEKIERKPK